MGFKIYEFKNFTGEYQYSLVAATLVAGNFVSKFRLNAC